MAHVISSDSTGPQIQDNFLTSRGPLSAIFKADFLCQEGGVDLQNLWETKY